MSEQIIRPGHPLLRQIVEYYWILEGKAEYSSDSALIYPEMCSEIIFNFGEPTRWVGNGHQLHLSGSIFSPIRTGYYNIHPQGEVAYLAVRFWPGSIPLLSIPADQFANRALALEDVLSIELRHAFAPLYAMDTMPDRLNYLEKVLSDWVVRHTLLLPQQLRYAVSLLQQSAGRIPIQNVAEQSGFYARKLERQFLRYLGVSPKTCARILRFNSTMNQIMGQPGVGTTDALYRSGYADQAHFIRECREFTGRTPGELFRTGTI